MIRKTLAGKSLSLCFLATSVSAGEFFESTYRSIQDPAPTLGWGGFALSSGGDSGLVNLSPLYVELPLGENIQIPATLSTTQYITGSVEKKSDIAHAILSPYAGTLNVNIGLFQGSIKDLNSTGGEHHEGLCAFPSDISGMCIWELSLGVKSIEYLSHYNHYNTTSAFYANAGVKLDVPIKQLDQENSNRLTLSALFVMQRYDTSGLFRAYYDDPAEDHDDWLKSVELGLNYTVSKSVSIQLTGSVFSSEKKLERLPKLELIYRPYY